MDSARHYRNLIQDREGQDHSKLPVNYKFLGDVSFAEQDFEQARMHYESAITTNFNEDGIFEFVEEAEMGTLGALTFIVMCINLTLVALSKKLVGKGAFEM